jgi:uncharacterized membrane protein YkoI
MRKLLIAFGTLALATTSIAASAVPAAKTTTSTTATTATTTTKPTFKGAELAAQATITMDAARTSALKARPGKITDAELEKERGGSGLRYSFDITSKGKAYEVGIDAKTGKILENKAEGKHAD